MNSAAGWRTAYTDFSSKNHLIAEVYLDLMKQVPYFTDVNEPMPQRVEQALRAMALAAVLTELSAITQAIGSITSEGGPNAVLERAVADRAEYLPLGTQLHVLATRR
mgnify:CR=1 FL=1